MAEKERNRKTEKKEKERKTPNALRSRRTNYAALFRMIRSVDWNAK